MFFKIELIHSNKCAFNIITSGIFIFYWDTNLLVIGQMPYGLGDLSLNERYRDLTVTLPFCLIFAGTLSSCQASSSFSLLIASTLLEPAFIKIFLQKLLSLQINTMAIYQSGICVPICERLQFLLTLFLSTPSLVLPFEKENASVRIFFCFTSST